MNRLYNNSTMPKVVERSLDSLRHAQIDYATKSDLLNQLPEGLEFYHLSYKHGYDPRLILEIHVDNEKDVLPYYQKFNIVPMGIVERGRTWYDSVYPLVWVKERSFKEVYDEIMPVAWSIQQSAFSKLVYMTMFASVGEYIAELKFNVKNSSANISATNQYKNGRFFYDDNCELVNEPECLSHPCVERIKWNRESNEYMNDFTYYWYDNDCTVEEILTFKR